MAIIKHPDTTVVEAILTKKGREILASGQTNFNIVKFAVSDDEVDYNLWDDTKSSDEKGMHIESMPVLEASINEQNNMKYLLASYSIKNLSSVPFIIAPTENSIVLNANTTYNFTPATTDGYDIRDYGYTIYVNNSDLVTVSITDYAGAHRLLTETEDSRLITAVGVTFSIKAKVLTETKTGFITIVGNVTGASKTISLTVLKYLATGSNV